MLMENASSQPSALIGLSASGSCCVFHSSLTALGGLSLLSLEKLERTWFYYYSINAECTQGLLANLKDGAFLL